jgi:succinoglycan biosynthesis protein ExoA
MQHDISESMLGTERRSPPFRRIVSVVVPCRNEIINIREFLDSLLCQDVGEIEMEILIADGMSDDGTRQVLDEFEREYAAIQILDNPECIVSTGLNRAIRRARGEIIVRMDVHTCYAGDYVRTCVEVLDETKADNVGGPPMTRANGYVAQAIALGFHAPFASGGAKFRDPSYEGPADTVTYGCWRKSTLERLGLFDEEMVRTQDYELNARLISRGGTVWQSPKIKHWYQPRSTLSGLFRQYFQYGFWKAQAVRKHGRNRTWRHLVPGSCLIAGTVLLLFSWAANFGGAVWWRNIFLADLFFFAGVYLTVSLLQSFWVAHRQGWRYLPIMPFVFGTYHLSYALGFVLSLLYRPATASRPNPIRKVLMSLTR